MENKKIHERINLKFNKKLISLFMIIINGKTKENKILYTAKIFVNLSLLILNLTNLHKVTYLKISK